MVRRSQGFRRRLGARSIAPLRICGPGISTMQGLKATGVGATGSWIRLAAATQSGWISGLSLKPDNQRRTSAPMAALAAISNRPAASSAQNITPGDAAPRAANKVKRGVEAGGRRPADSSADCAVATGNVPSQSRSITVVTASTLSTSTPSGLEGTMCETGAPSTLTVSCPNMAAHSPPRRARAQGARWRQPFVPWSDREQTEVWLPARSSPMPSPGYGVSLFRSVNCVVRSSSQSIAHFPCDRSICRRPWPP